MEILLLVLFLCTILSTSKSDQLEDSEEITTESSIEIRRLPIFPKYSLKFTVKPHETNKELATQNILVREEYKTRKPLMVKMVPRTKKTGVKTTEIVTRKPLMKLRSYTVKMRSLKKETINNVHKQENIRKIQRSFEIDDKPEMKKSLSQNNKDESVNNNRNTISTGFIKNVPQLFKADDFSEEEDQDRHEFIFLEKNKGLMDDLLYVSEEDFEMTTISTEPRRLRRKRSSNIIEEENMGTTVSPLKYTGHDSRLTNDLYFKNINH